MDGSLQIIQDLLEFKDLFTARLVKEEGFGLVKDKHSQLAEVDVSLPARDVVKDLPKGRDQYMCIIVELICGEIAKFVAGCMLYDAGDYAGNLVDKLSRVAYYDYLDFLD